MKEHLEFNNPKTVDEAIWKAQIWYQHMKQKGEGSKVWLSKKGTKNSQSTKNAKNGNTINPHKPEKTIFLGKNNRNSDYKMILSR